MWDETKKKRVVAMGHSKGGLDIAAALALEEKRLEEKLSGIRVRPITVWRSPIMEDLLSNKYVRSGVHLALEAAFGERRNSEAIQKMVKPVEDLTYRRNLILKKHPLPEQFRDKTVCFHSKTTSKDSTMANIALYVSSQYNEEGDGLVCRSDGKSHTRESLTRNEVDPIIIRRFRHRFQISSSKSIASSTLKKTNEELKWKQNALTNSVERQTRRVDFASVSRVRESRARPASRTSRWLTFSFNSK